MKEALPTSTRAETALDIAAFVSSAVPWIGGPVSSVLSGVSLERKLKRVREVVVHVVNDLREFESDVSKDYVQTEEFEELLEQTLKRVGEERNEKKRLLYRSFLTSAIKSPGVINYDDQILMLRTLDELKLRHLGVLKAMLVEPVTDREEVSSPTRTLIERLPDLDRDEIDDLVSQLYDMQLVVLPSFRKLITGPFAADLRPLLSEHGRRLVDYIVEDSPCR